MGKVNGFAPKQDSFLIKWKRKIGKFYDDNFILVVTVGVLVSFLLVVLSIYSLLGGFDHPKSSKISEDTAIVVIELNGPTEYDYYDLDYENNICIRGSYTWSNSSIVLIPDAKCQQLLEKYRYRRKVAEEK